MIRSKRMPLGACVALGLGWLLFASPAGAHIGPDDHAPIGVMGDHTHGGGEIMLSYRYMRMAMEGNRKGKDRVDVDDFLNAPPGPYVVMPLSMDMDMHMFSAMYAPIDYLTLMVMVPYIQKSMDHVNFNQTNLFTTKSSGVGDVKVTALVPFWKTEKHRAHVGFGVSAPAGSIRATDDTPLGNQRLPYPMQLGSGTWDLLMQATYSGFGGPLGWGAQVAGTVRTGRNDLGYRLGNRVLATGWLSYRVLEWLSSGLRLEWQSWGNIEGSDPAQNPNFVPTADPDRRGGDRLDMGFSLNTWVPGTPLKGLRVNFEVLVPVYQKLDGPQLETDWTFIGGLQYAF